MYCSVMYLRFGREKRENNTHTGKRNSGRDHDRPRTQFCTSFFSKLPLLWPKKTLMAFIPFLPATHIFRVFRKILHFTRKRPLCDMLLLICCVVLCFVCPLCPFRSVDFSLSFFFYFTLLSERTVLQYVQYVNLSQ